MNVHCLTLVLPIFFLDSAFGLVKPVFFIEGDGWQNTTHSGYIAHFKIPVKVQLKGWWIALIYDQPVAEIEAWQGINFKTSDDGKILYLKQISWNKNQYPGMVMDQRYLVNFPKQPGVNYNEYFGPRPAIVFVDKVYVPEPEENHEHEMAEYDIDEYDLPSNFEMLPLTVVTPPPTASTASTTPRTRGPNDGKFWWVNFPPNSRRRSSVAPTKSTTSTVMPTTTTKPVYSVSCEKAVTKTTRECKRRNRPLTHCFIPQCSEEDIAIYKVVQCWKHLGSCWCVNPYTGLRPKTRSTIVRFREAHQLNCFAVLAESTIAAPTTTVSQRATLPTQPPGSSPLQRPLFVPRSDYDYNWVLHNSLLFFEAQRSGDIGTNGRVFWRRSAHFDDGGDCSMARGALSGGYYVAGGYVKFGFPTAAAMTMLAWSFLEYRDAFDQTSQTHFLKEALKWGADYFLKAHTSPNVLVGQVGNPDIENSYWERPQDMRVTRPCYSITTKNPGSDLAGETAAALAATAKVLLVTGTSISDPYVQRLLMHARQLYNFAVNYRGTYSFSIRQAMAHFPSSSYQDEVVWAALWLYEATGDTRYFAAAERFYDEFKLDAAQGELSWDTKTVAVQFLLAKYNYKTGNKNSAQRYMSRVIEFCDHSRPGNARYTPRGLLFISEWGTTRYASNAAFLCMTATKLPGMDNNLKTTYRQFAETQADYILGRTGQSYVIGYGNKFPRNPHHRSSSCSLVGACGWDVYHGSATNVQTLFGAMVGGPGEYDEYSDNRANLTYNSVGLDYNAGLQGLVAGLKHFQIEYHKWIKYTRQSK